MKPEELIPNLQPLPGAMPVWRGTVDAAAWRATAPVVREQGGRLVALWGSDEAADGFAVHAALAVRQGVLWLTLPLAGRQPEYPDLGAVFPAAQRMQRAAHDLLGIRATGADTRKWLRHGAWPDGEFPLRKSFDARAAAEAARRFDTVADDYPFVAVQGEGVHEIPVGPVHAGIIEPGHFRFSVVGERVLRLEERLGYVHKGIEKRFESLGIHDGFRLAGRVSGDSTVAYAWAYAMAAEAAAGLTPPPRALWLRALLLERERIANHLGDLGHLGNDAGLAIGLAQFSRLKEDWLRANAMLFGHRYLMDRVIPGGVACDLSAEGAHQILREIARSRAEVARLKIIFDEHPGLQDRLIGTGRVVPELADRLGLTGLAGRASGMAWDLRVELPCTPYDALEVAMATHRNGDVAARVTVRFEEVLASLDLCEQIVEHLPEGNVATLFPSPREGASGAGWVEGWRGEVFVALEAGANGALRRAHAHDPSWQNWPVLEHAVIGNIVPDFPLINKSFNLSYSGVDL
ncbi:MAG TPA: NADH-quinone oxidoreductase subunit C [Burkholderiales bacterium]|jgi:Ni,Fe-hydrogenase III large subunit/Ni,Fe-hydrogenase III component G